MGRTRIAVLVAVVATLAGCGGDDAGGDSDELGSMTCAQMIDEQERFSQTLEGDLLDLAMYRYVAAQADVPAESLIPPEENEGWMTWFIYYCTQDDPSRTAEEAFARAEEVVEESGGPAAAEERYERVSNLEEPPPP